MNDLDEITVHSGPRHTVFDLPGVGTLSLRNRYAGMLANVAESMGEDYVELAEEIREELDQ